MKDPLEQAIDRLDIEERTLAKRYLSEVDFEVGEQVTTRGTNDPALAWIRTGSAELRVGRRLVVQLDAGGIVGGEDLFGQQYRTFTTVASTPLRLVVADARGLEGLRTYLPAVAAVLELAALDSLGSLLRALDQQAIADTRAFVREHIAQATGSFPLLANLLDPSLVPGSPATWLRPRALPPLLAALPDPIRETLAGSVSGISLRAGQVLINEGEESNSVFLVVDGTLKVVARVNDDLSLQLSELGPNAVVGVTSSNHNRIHSASCIAATAVQVLRIDQTVWLTLLSVPSTHGSELRTIVLQAMSSWIPPIRDRVECSNRCLRGVIHKQLSGD